MIYLFDRTQYLYSLPSKKQKSTNDILRSTITPYESAGIILDYSPEAGLLLKLCQESIR